MFRVARQNKINENLCYAIQQDGTYLNTKSIDNLKGTVVDILKNEVVGTENHKNRSHLLLCLESIHRSSILI